MELKCQENICQHDKFKYTNKNPEADGIEDVIFIEIICETCNKILVTIEECISASSTIIHDKEWGKRHDFRDEYF